MRRIVAHFVGVEDRAEVGAIAFQDRGQRGRHAHVFVARDHARLDGAGRAQRMQRGDRRLGEAHVLLVVPDVLVLAAVDAELFPELEFELADLLRVVAADVDQQNFRHADDAGFLVDELPPAVDDADVERLLDLAEPRRQRRAVERIEAAVEHFALRARGAARRYPSLGQNGPTRMLRCSLVEIDWLVSRPWRTAPMPPIF